MDVNETTAFVRSSARLHFVEAVIITNLSPKDTVQIAVVNEIELDHFSVVSTPLERTDYLGNARFVAFDTETTGMFAISNRIVELAGIRFGLNDDAVETFSALVNPQRPIPREVIGIHR
jgi:DNA polymerase III epsilon subunit-like protein